ncbi:YlmC/YmxH family sporulation protein [Jeotgalibacillus soli]|uniref:YlmC/YmxH family sporulation protein n=1 Tax=Jeotgalibacillus soli TaxID=889306 RepID=A0A0C2R3U8_9BACL|nr:YlmC/YmxH family sporulation protein [Jeotgalibacillus soli]KIL44935.1 ylmC/YmxH family sporulation protein [Jeotgalibacillus soli]
MRLSELSGKEMIHIQRAERLGILGETDVQFDPETGKVLAVIIPLQKWPSFGKGQKELSIPWRSIRTIGTEMILIDQSDESHSPSKPTLHTIGQNEDHLK